MYLKYIIYYIAQTLLSTTYFVPALFVTRISLPSDLIITKKCQRVN